jgi:hypothetical protein
MTRGTLTVRDYREIDCTPMRHVVFPKVIGYESADYQPATEHEVQEGFMFDIYQHTMPVNRDRNEGPERDVLIPNVVNLWVYAGDPSVSGGLCLEHWNTPVVQLEAFARAILEAVSEGRRQGLWE